MKKSHIILPIIVLLLIATTGWFYLFMRDQQNILVVSPSVEEKKIGIEKRIAPPVDQNDPDGDGVVNEDEDLYGTDRLHYDTDGDGISDFIEINQTKTDPTKADTDGDGFSDLVEISNGYDPLVP